MTYNITPNPGSIVDGFRTVDGADIRRLIENVNDVTQGTGPTPTFSGPVTFGPQAYAQFNGLVQFTGLVFALSFLTGSGAVPAHLPNMYVITDAGAAALTLAAPTAMANDGNLLFITSSTAFAHTLTATGLLQTGAAAVNLATFAAHAGAGLCLMAYNGFWIVLFSVGITFS